MTAHTRVTAAPLSSDPSCDRVMACRARLDCNRCERRLHLHLEHVAALLLPLACHSTPSISIPFPFYCISIAFTSHSTTFPLHFHCISIAVPLQFHCSSIAFPFTIPRRGSRCAACDGAAGAAPSCARGHSRSGPSSRTCAASRVARHKRLRRRPSRARAIHAVGAKRSHRAIRQTQAWGVGGASSRTGRMRVSRAASRRLSDLINVTTHTPDGVRGGEEGSSCGMC